MIRVALVDVQAGYGRTEVLRGLTLHADPGEIVAIIGPNGAGKSTVLRAVYGQCDVWRGEVRLGGSAVTGTPAHRLVRLGVACVPQGRTVFPSLTVAENLDLGVYHEGGRPDPARLDEAFARFPVLADRRHQRAGTLSGGEQQMLAFARALLSRPRLLLLDEPSLGLAPRVQDLLFQVVADVNAAGVTVLMVEQNARRALALAHRAYVLELGRSRFEGPGRALLADPRVEALYLGQAGREGHPAEDGRGVPPG